MNDDIDFYKIFEKIWRRKLFFRRKLNECFLLKKRFLLLYDKCSDKRYYTEVSASNQALEQCKMQLLCSMQENTETIEVDCLEKDKKNILVKIKVVFYR